MTLPLQYYTDTAVDGDRSGAVGVGAVCRRLSVSYTDAAVTEFPAVDRAQKWAVPVATRRATGRQTGLCGELYGTALSGDSRNLNTGTRARSVLYLQVFLVKSFAHLSSLLYWQHAPPPVRFIHNAHCTVQTIALLAMPFFAHLSNYFPLCVTD